MSNETKYTEDNIRSLDWKEHIRMRPGMYIGKLGDGSSADDGIYILVKEVLDNSIDEYVMGAGKTIEISIQGSKVTVRDYGRGIPLGKVVDVVSELSGNLSIWKPNDDLVSPGPATKLKRTTSLSSPWKPSTVSTNSRD